MGTCMNTLKLLWLQFLDFIEESFRASGEAGLISHMQIIGYTDFEIEQFLAAHPMDEELT